MTAVSILGLAASLSLLAGWRLYATVLFTGLVARFGWFDLPPQLASLHALASPWVIGISALGFVAEFFADKIAWLDSLWDTVHTVIRPLGGALLALTVVSPQDPTMQIITFLLGGGAALISHSAKAGTRAVINTSPEPISNVAMSAVEDVATTGGLTLAMSHPAIAGGVSIVLLAFFAWVVYRLWRSIKLRLGQFRQFFGLDSAKTDTQLKG